MPSKVAPDATGAIGEAADTSQESHSLRRAVGVWRSYPWGYPDRGPGVYANQQDLMRFLVRWISSANHRSYSSVSFLLSILHCSSTRWSLHGLIHSTWHMEPRLRLSRSLGWNRSARRARRQYAPPRSYH